MERYNQFVNNYEKYESLFMEMEYCVQNVQNARKYSAQDGQFTVCTQFSGIHGFIALFFSHSHSHYNPYFEMCHSNLINQTHKVQSPTL